MLAFTTLLFALVYRDLTQRYRRSLLGPLWAILQPLLLMVVFNLLRNLVNISSEGVPYVIFSYSGLVPWTFFSNAVILSSMSLGRNADIIKKSASARELFPLSAVITALFDFFIASLILMGMMVWYRLPVTYLCFWLPLLVILIMLLAFGVGMFISALGAFKRDFIFATPFLMQLWLYITPVIYSLKAVPEKRQALYMLNPMVGVIEGFRQILIHGQPPPIDALFFSFAGSGAILLIAWPVFRWLSKYVADVM